MLSSLRVASPTSYSRARNQGAIRRDDKGAMTSNGGRACRRNLSIRCSKVGSCGGATTHTEARLACQVGEYRGEFVDRMLQDAWAIAREPEEYTGADRRWSSAMLRKRMHNDLLLCRG